RPRRDLDAAVERIVLVLENKIGAPAVEKLAEHLAEIDPDLLEGFCEKFLGRAVDPCDHVKDLAARGDEIAVLRFEKTVALFEFVVLVHGLEIARPHVLELPGEIGDELFEILRIWVDRPTISNSSSPISP